MYCHLYVLLFVEKQLEIPSGWLFFRVNLGSFSLFLLSILDYFFLSFNCIGYISYNMSKVLNSLLKDSHFTNTKPWHLTWVCTFESHCRHCQCEHCCSVPAGPEVHYSGQAGRWPQILQPPRSDTSPEHIYVQSVLWSHVASWPGRTWPRPSGRNTKDQHRVRCRVLICKI